MLRSERERLRKGALERMRQAWAVKPKSDEPPKISEHTQPRATTTEKDITLKIHLKGASTDKQSLCRALPGARWILQDALADQASGTVCRSCANNANKAEPDEEESRLLADLEACRAEELVTADKLSNPRKNNLYSSYRDLIDALKAIRLKCEQKLQMYRAYRQKLRNRA